jgi:hypothetical protein
MDDNTSNDKAKMIEQREMGFLRKRISTFLYITVKK